MMFATFWGHRKIGSKLLLAACLTALVNILATGYIILNVMRVQQGEAVLYTHNMPLRGAEHNSWITLRTLDDDAAHLVLNPNDAAARAAEPKFADDVRNLTKYMDQIHAIANTPEEIRLADLYLSTARGANGFIAADERGVALRLAGHRAEAAKSLLAVSTIEAEKYVDDTVNLYNV